jgi:DNA polymerase-4
MSSGDAAERGRLDVLHVDMDCFFAAVEALDDESLRRRPLIVGGIGPRGVVASCSYEARAEGVRSAMPMSEARRRCPGAVVVAGRYERYSEMSARLHEVLYEFTPVIEPVALDEAYLDVAGSHLLFGDSLRIGRLIRERVLDSLSLCCSVGVGRTKLVAKLASREAKPRPSKRGPMEGTGVVAVSAEDEIAFLHPRPVRDLFGVGPRTAEQLARYGVKTVGDLAHTDVSVLERLVGRAAGRHLHALSWGRDDVPVEPQRMTKSVGHEETFPRDVADDDVLRVEIVRLSDSVGRRLRAAELSGRTVTVKLRYGDFSTITRSHSLRRPVLSSAEIARIGEALLESVDVSPGVRLIGVSVSSLERSRDRTAMQLSLMGLGDPAEGEGSVAGGLARADVEAAVDAIRRRYGSRSVGPASLLSEGGPLRTKELGDAQWG